METRIRYIRTLEGVDAEYALHDAMDTVCQYIDMKDLCHVAQVCKSWKAAASRETAKRSHIQQLLIPRIFEDITNRNARFHVSDVLNVKPHVALLFLGSKLREENPENLGSIHSLDQEVLNLYKQQFPHKMIGLEVREFLTDEDVVYSSPDMQNHFALETGGREASILGLFLPSQRETRVRAAWSRGRNGSICDVANRMVEKLAFAEDDRPSTLLVFAQSLKGYFVAEQFIKTVRVRFPNDKAAIWGGVFNKEIVAANCQRERSNNRSSSDPKIFVGLRITGPSLESWCATIDCSVKRCEVDRQMYELAERMAQRRKRCTLGLAYGPRYAVSARLYCDDYYRQNSYRDNRDLMRAIKRVFPSVPFVGLFNRDCKIFGDFINEDMSQRLDHHKYMSMIIMTYD